MADPPKPQPPNAVASAPKPETETGRVKLDDGPATPRSPSQWLELSTPTPAKHGTEFVMVGAELGTFSRLRFDAAKGLTNVKSVRVRFSDGTSKTYKVSATLREHGRTFSVVELGTTKPIEQLAITTDRTSGTYAVYGSSGTGTGTAVSTR